MKPDKYCYEIIQHEGVPEKYSAKVVKFQRYIETYLNSEKFTRKKNRQQSYSEFQKELNSDTFMQKYKQDLKAGKDVIEKNNPGKTKDDKQKRNNLYKFDLQRVKHLHYDESLFYYEKKYHINRPNLIQLGNSIRDLPPELYFGVGKNNVLIMIKCPELFCDLIIARIYTGDARFKLKTPSNGSVRDVYCHIANGREYVKDANGIFVKRYVLRNLSKGEDLENKVILSRKYPQDCKEPPLTRENIANIKSKIDDTIMVHLRGAQNSLSPFISFTTTINPIVGSTGTPFYDSKNGQVIIDLAKIDQDCIYDLHALPMLDKLMSGKPIRWNLEYADGDVDFEINAAVRDTLRTREILIYDIVLPKEIVAWRKGTGDWQFLNGITTLPKGYFPV